MKKYISLFAATALLIAACGQKEEPVVVDNSSVDLSELSVTAGPEGGEYTVNVTSSEGWRVSGLCDWVTLAADSGASGTPLRLTVAPNHTEKVRTATFKVFAGSAVKALLVTSNPAYVIELAGDEKYWKTRDEINSMFFRPAGTGGPGQGAGREETADIPLSTG